MSIAALGIDLGKNSCSLAEGKWPAGATATSLAQAGQSPSVVARMPGSHRRSPSMGRGAN